MLSLPRFAEEISSSKWGCQGFDLETKHWWHAEDDRLAS